MIIFGIQFLASWSRCIPSCPHFLPILDAIDGINAVYAFLDLVHSAPEKWHETKNVSVVFRLVVEKEGIKGNPMKGSALWSLFCSASRLRPKVLKRAIEIIMENSSVLDSTNIFRTSPEFDEESSEALVDISRWVGKFKSLSLEFWCFYSLTLSFSKMFQ